MLFRSCPYCDFTTYSGLDALIPAYVDALETAIKREGVARQGRAVQTVFFGGGTPSLPEPAQIERLIGAIARGFALEPDAEITLEANPNSADQTRFTGYRAAGINRLSIGVQTTDRRGLRVLGRNHEARDAEAALIAALSGEPLDRGTAHFQPSNLEFTSVDVGNTAWNVIPGQARARFNIRYNDAHTRESLRALIEERVTRASGNRIKARIVWEPSNADVFLTEPGPFTELVAAAIEEVTGRRPEFNTGGGTSDARFITHYCPVLEFGLVGQTMHQIDERTPVADIENLTRIYRGVLERYFA